MRKATLYIEDFNGNGNCSFLHGSHDSDSDCCSLTSRKYPNCKTCKITQVDYHEDGMDQGIFKPDAFTVRRTKECWADMGFDLTINT